MSKMRKEDVRGRVEETVKSAQLRGRAAGTPLHDPIFGGGILSFSMMPDFRVKILQLYQCTDTIVVLRRKGCFQLVTPSLSLPPHPMLYHPLEA